VAELPALALILGTAIVYLAGVRRAWRVAGSGRVVRVWQVVVFVAGLLTAAVALSPAFDHAGASTFAGHMVQHVLLLAVAAPFLAVGAPLPTLLWALPPVTRARGLGWWRRLLRVHSSRRWVAWAVATLLVQAATMWVWHLPALYEAALRSPPLHALEHLSMLATATAFWWAVAGGRRTRFGAGVLVVFVGGFPGTALGAALLLAPNPWYPSYVTSTVPKALADQQLAGVVMWSVAGVAYVIAAAVLFGAWLANGERTDPSRAVQAPPLGATG
jgi:cytochrome c oxidase assembly factor CtaG